MPEQIKTARQLAMALERHHSTLHDWLISAAWPFPRVAPWPMEKLPEMRAWAATRPPPGFSPANWLKHQAKQVK